MTGPSVRAWLPVDLLLPRDRPARRPLVTWAERIRRALTAEVAHQPPDLRAVCAQVNLAALVEASRGELVGARALCRAQLRWLARLLSEGAAREEVLPLAVQPWINLGRLLRIEGRTADSLAHFGLARHCAERRPLTAGFWRVDESDYAAVFDQDPSIVATLWNIYVLDSLKSYFQAGEFGAALRLVRRRGAAADADGSGAFLAEAEVICHLRTASYGRAADLAGAWAERGDVLTALVFELYGTVAKARAGSVAPARTQARTLLALTAHDLPDPPPAGTMLRYVQALGQVCEELGDNRTAYACYRRGLEIAVSADDEPGRAGFLRRMIPLSAQRLPDRPSASLSDDVSGHVLPDPASMLSALRATTCYTEILRSTGGPPVRQHPAFDELRSTVSRVLAPATGVRTAALTAGA